MTKYGKIIKILFLRWFLILSGTLSALLPPMASERDGALHFLYCGGWRSAYQHLLNPGLLQRRGSAWISAPRPPLEPRFPRRRSPWLTSTSRYWAWSDRDLTARGLRVRCPPGPGTGVRGANRCITAASQG